MAKLMRDDARGEADGMTDLMKVIAELTNECFFGQRASEKLSVGGQRIEEAKEP